MSGRYIDAEDFFDTFPEIDKIPYSTWAATHLADIRENVRGHWTNLQISIADGSCADCSNCGATVYVYITSTINYCPNCGADMRGENK